MKKKNNAYITMLPYVVVAVVIVIALLLLNGNQTKVNDIKTGELIDAIQNKEVTTNGILDYLCDNVVKLYEIKKLCLSLQHKPKLLSL